MKRQELEELFPVGCVVSQDIKEKLGFGEWRKVMQCVIPFETMNLEDSDHTLAIDKMPSHSFGRFDPQPLVDQKRISYQRVG